MVVKPDTNWPVKAKEDKPQLAMSSELVARMVQVSLRRLCRRAVAQRKLAEAAG